MELNQDEREALTAWMADKGLSQAAVGAILDVGKVAVHQWLHGGGIRPAQHAKLVEQIRPYLAAKPAPAPELALRVAQLEAMLAKLLPALENRAYRDFEAPLRLAAGGGIPQAPTLAKTAIIEGESMEPTYRHGQEVAISHFAEPIILGAAGYLDFAYIKQRLKSGGHYWLQLNEGGLTVKGLELEPPNDRGVWRLILVADNPHWGEEFGYKQGRRALHFGETLQIYGTVRKGV